MTKLQLVVVGSALLLFLVLYIGCETTPRDFQTVEKSRSLALASTNLEVLLQEAKEELEAGALNDVLVLETKLEEALDDTERVELMKQLSSRWFGLGHPAVAGSYAERIATIEGTEESWSIAGTTFTICVQRSQEEKIRNYCTTNAVKAFESAISINPSNISHKVNLALLYAENPPADNPMRGITMLLDLNREHSENVLVLNTLARLAIRTGQYDRAIERLEKARSIEPNNANTSCLLSQAYEGNGNTEQAQAFAERCQDLMTATQ